MGEGDVCWRHELATQEATQMYKREPVQSLAAPQDREGTNLATFPINSVVLQ